MMQTNLYNMDCLAFMKMMPDQYYDLAIVDPPYGIGATGMNMGSVNNRFGKVYNAQSTAKKVRKSRISGGCGTLRNRTLNKLNSDWDATPPPPEYFEELFRVSRHQIIWGGNYFNLPPTRCLIVWDKLQPWENFSQVEIAWTSFSRPSLLYRQSTTGGRNNEKKICSTQKPVELYGWTLNKFACSGQKILDTHMGSASSVVIACEKLGFSIDSCESDFQMFNEAKQRLEHYRNSPLLIGFTSEQMQQECLTLDDCNDSVKTGGKEKCMRN